MRRNGRKQITRVGFRGVATDGGFVFEADVSSFNNLGKYETTEFKATAYEDGVMEIAIDCAEGISRVAEVVSGMFSRKSNFCNLEYVILNYNNIRLQIGKNTGRKDIICMFMKAVSMPDCKVQDVEVDTQICQAWIPLRNSDSLGIGYKFYASYFKFDEIFKVGKLLWFKNPHTRDSLIISSLKDGTVTVESIAGDSISDFVGELREFFNPYSEFYGVKAVEAKINDFSIKIDEQNAGRILNLYKRSCSMDRGLWDRERQSHQL